jgi:phosphoglycolate phosphatase
MATVYFGELPFDAKLIVFDKDGTLIDLGRLWAGKAVAGVERLVGAVGGDAALRVDLYRTLGYDPATGRFAEQGPLVTAAMHELYIVAATVLHQHGTGWLEAMEAANEHLALGMAGAFGPELLQPLADLPALFGALRAQGVRLALLTSDDGGPAQRTLELLGIAGCVGFVAGADGPYRSKPAPDALLAACDYFEVAPEKTAMVGDSTTDLVMAERANVGLRVGVLSGAMGRDLLEPLAHTVIGSVADIRAGHLGAGGA